MPTNPIFRFAPSPNGYLHLGHAYSALFTDHWARALGGTFLLRLEDIDPLRSKPEFAQAIFDDLAWLGLTWPAPVLRQSDRLPVYVEAAERLRDMGLLYPCYCTRADIAREIAAAGAAPHGPDGALYPGTCRDRSGASADAPHALRLDMAAAVRIAGPLDWIDECAGRRRADPAAFGDVVLARKETPTSYHLAVTVDDAAQGITHVVRGADLFAATDVHRLLQALLGLPTPTYHHHRLITDASGQRLAKRYDAPTLAALRDAGIDGLALADDLRTGRKGTGFTLEKG